jgi:hypothetical protein
MKFVDVMTVDGLLVGRKAVVIRFGSSVGSCRDNVMYIITLFDSQFMQDDDLYMVVYSVILYTTSTWCVLHRLVYSLIPSMHIFDFFPNRSRLDSSMGRKRISVPWYTTSYLSK